MTDPSPLELIFFAALEKRSVAERKAYLDEACAGNPDQRAQLDRMLSAQVHAGSFLERPAITHDETVQHPEAAVARPGTIVGHYKILQQLGEGGMGVVFMAAQSTPIQRTVALKIIKPEMDSRQVIARFEAERQALAMMDHPNVAKVLDAGTTEGGLPYFVMELVKGIPITRYCDERHLSLRKRLELFLPVCEAVQHAHQKGLIHRDIKPTNVLVAEYDDRAVPKVIDFGVAKATAQNLTERTMFTEFGQVVGTLEYMSPEQAKLNQLDIDTRSDIYSLGVLFYELLTGSTPFGRKRLQELAFDEMLRIIREEEPPKPSTRLSTADGLPSIAANRGSESVRLTNTVRGELDWIVMKSLEKDRNRRYDSASGLAMDIHRYLAGEPVLAAPPSVRYRLRKFASKHRVALTATAAALLLLAGVAMFSTWQAARARRAELIALQTKEDEISARKRAEAIAAFVTTALKASDARNVGGGQDVTIWHAMENAISDIDSGRFRDEPETEADLQDTIAMILLNNGRYVQAEPLFMQALETRQRVMPGDSVRVGDSLNHVAVVLLAMDRNAEAESVATRALAMNQRLHPGDHRDVADSLNYLARSRQALGRLSDAEPLFVQSLEMWQRLFKGDNKDVAVCLRDLAEVRLLQGQLEDAERLYLQSLEMNQRLYPGDHPATAMAMTVLADARMALGRSAEAESLFTQALEMQRRLFNADHPDIGRSLYNLALARQALGRIAEADPLLVEALEMFQRLYKFDRPEIVQCLNTLAGMRLAQGRAAEAEPLFLRALDMNRRLVKGDDVAFATTLSNLARTRHALGKSAEARQGFDQSIAMLRRLEPNGSPLYARVLWRSGSTRLDNNDPAAALPELEEAVAMAKTILPPGHPQLIEYTDTLARCKALLAK